MIGVANRFLNVPKFVIVKVPPLNVVRREFVVACLVCQSVYGDSQAVQVQLVGVANNRDNQIPVIQRDCDSYIDMFLQNDLVAVDGGVYPEEIRTRLLLLPP